MGQEAPAAAGVDKSEDRVRQMFGEIARRYDLLNHLLSGGVDYYWRWRTVRRCPPRINADGTAAPILDVCTGTGDLALAYWDRGGRQIEVMATDFTPEMLDLARKKCTRRRDARPGGQTAAPVTFLEADTQHLPLPDNTYQIVSVAFGLRNVTNTRRGLEEMIRVCQPGGRVVVLEFSLPTNGFLRWLYLSYFQKILPKIGQWLMRNRRSAYQYLPDSVAEFPYGQALADQMTAAGLEQVSFQPLTFGIATIYLGTKPQGNGAAGKVAQSPA